MTRARHDVTRNKASLEDVAGLLTACDRDFSPPLSDRQNIPAYAERICLRAERFEYWGGSQLVGLVAMYCVTPEGAPAFITNVSVRSDQRGLGLADALLAAALTHARACGFAHVALSVDANATAALRLYAKHNFVRQNTGGTTFLLQAKL